MLKLFQIFIGVRPLKKHNELMDEIKGIADRIISAFSHILSLPPERLKEVGVLTPIPTFDAQEIAEISARAKDAFDIQDTLIEIAAPVYVIGDLHGNIFDLIRILVMSGPPPANRFLFLGDYVDRGQYSVEIVALLFAFMAKYPQHMFLLRGNHEFERVNSVYGFKNEVEAIYGSQGEELYAQINKCFNYMPLAAVVNGNIFCVHGGISPQVSSYRQLKRMKKPIPTYDNNIACDLTWSDPSVETKDFLRSTRGNGVAFGVNAVKDFQKAFKVKHILRAHQCVELGIERFAGDVLYTVFSCSNYQDGSGNKCGLIYVNAEGNVQSFSLPPIDQVPRENALLTNGDQAGLTGLGEDRPGMTLSGVTNDSKRGSILCLVQSPSAHGFGFTKKRQNASVARVHMGSKLPKLNPNSEVKKRPATAEPVPLARI